MRLLFVFLVLGGLAAAQESGEFDAAKALKEAQDRLGALGAAESEEAQRWKTVVEERIALLQELIDTGTEKSKLADPAQLAPRKATVESELEVERRKTAPGSVTLESPDQLPDYEAPYTRAKAERDETQASLERTRQQLSDAEAELTGIPGEEAAAKRKLAEASGEDDFARYRAENTRIKLRLLSTRAAYLLEARAWWSALVPVLELEADRDRLRSERTQKTFDLAREEAARLREEEARRVREKAEAEKRAAERERDPLERFRRREVAEAAQVRSEAGALQTVVESVNAAVAEREASILRLQQDRDRLENRLQLRQDATAGLLRNILDRTRRNKQLLREVALPKASAAVAGHQAELVDTLERLWALQMPPEENPEFQALLASVPESRHAEARQVFSEVTEGKDGLIPALRDKSRVLEGIDSSYALLAEQNTQYGEELDRLEEFVLLRIYWIRSDPPFRFAPEKTAEELEWVAETWTKRSTLARVGPWRGAVIIVGLLVVLLASYLDLRVGRGLRRKTAEAPDAAPRQSIGRALGGLLLALLPAVAWFVFAGIVDALQLPKEFDPPLPRLLRSIALFVLAQRIGVWLLAPRGIAVQFWQTRPALARQVLRCLRIVTFCGVFFFSPAIFFRGEPFELEHITRVLDTLWLLGVALSLALLLRRKGALIQGIGKPGGVLQRLWFFIGPLVFLGLLGIVAMDVLGYRVGARYLMLNVVRTVVAILVLFGLYALSMTVVRMIAGAVRKRALEEEGAAAAAESAYSVAHELARLVGVVLVILALIFLMRFWGFHEIIVRSLEEVRIALVDEVDGDWLTLWEVLTAVFWIAGGHLLVGNLASLYESLVFPLLGEKTDKGGRYVALALSRYLVLVVAYAAAFLSLGFSFSQLGWTFAAISVGIGFGLQEIIANFISGLILLFERPVRVGDVITVGQTGGTVEKINIRATTVTNWDRQTIVIPNKNFITQNLTNWTHNDRTMRGVLSVGVAYGSDVEKVLKVLDEATGGHPKVLPDPPHRIWFDGFGDSSLNFTVWCFTYIDDRLQVRTDLYQRYYARFTEEGIEIPFPQRDLHIRSTPEDAGLAGLLEKRTDAPS